MNKLIPLINKYKVATGFIILFIFTLTYFLSLGRHIFTFQENNYLLIFTPGYLLPFLSRPGGITELAGKMLTQLYYHPVIGALLLSFMLLLPAIALHAIKRKSGSENLTNSGYLYFIPSFMLLLLQTFYYHFMEYNLGFILVIVYFYFTVYVKDKQMEILPLIMFPLFYYIAGGFALIFVIIYITFNIFSHNKKRRNLNILSMVAVLFLTVFVFKSVLTLQPYKSLLTYPLPDINVQLYKFIFYSLTLFLTLFPILQNINAPKYWSGRNRYPEILFIVFVLVTGAALFKLNNPQAIQAIELQDYITKGEWQQAIHNHEIQPSRNLIGQYFYNTALAETNQLCDRIFYGKQDFGTGSLVLPWQNEYLNWGVHFFYSVGLINEAHRWAYEEMIVYGPKPQNIMLLAKTNMINKNYDRAAKYIHLLKHTINYRKEANELENLNFNALAIAAHAEFKEKVKNMPKEMFFVDVSHPQNNIPLLLNGNPSNRKALEYQMAWYLLSKDVNSIINNIKRLKEAGYEEIPVHIEEAILAYENSTKNEVNLHGLHIRKQTSENFNKYVSSYKSLRNNNAMLKLKMEENYGNTFWYYFHFR